MKNYPYTVMDWVRDSEDKEAAILRNKGIDDPREIIGVLKSNIKNIQEELKCKQWRWKNELQKRRIKTS